MLFPDEHPTNQNLAASAFGLDRHEYRLTWDRSQVPALQEDEIAKHQMVREDYRAGVIDLYTATVQLGGGGYARGVSFECGSSYQSYKLPS